MYKKHVTLYGNSLSSSSDPGWNYLGQYDYIICSPHVLQRIEAKRPDLVERCFIYLDLFCHPRLHGIPGDVYPAPGDYFTDSTIHMKERGGTSYLYYLTDDWVSMFLHSVLEFLRGYIAKGLKIGGIFLDEWTISHTWYGLDQMLLEEIQGTAQQRRDHMTFVEKVLSKIAKVFTVKGKVVANGEHIFLDNPDVVLYHESVGSDWKPFDTLLDPTSVFFAKEGDFWQVNSSDRSTRWLAVYLGRKIGVSIGMQPNDGVLSYDAIEDTSSWPQ